MRPTSRLSTTIDPNIGTRIGIMATKTLKPVHPGDILLRDFMEPFGLPSCKLAKALSVSVPTVNEIACRRHSSGRICRRSTILRLRTRKPASRSNAAPDRFGSPMFGHYLPAEIVVP